MKKSFKIILSLFLVALIAVSAFTGCSDKKNPVTEDVSAAQDTVLQFEVIDDKSETTYFEVFTTRKTVGEALRDEGLIEERDLITIVNGIIADWEKDNAYWAFCINGVMATTGADDTNIEEGVVYAFVYTRG